MQHSKRNSETVIETTRSVDLLQRRRVARVGMEDEMGHKNSETQQRAERYRYPFCFTQLLLLR